MEKYDFVTNWYFEAPIEKVWREIEDGESWPTWLTDFKKISVRSREFTPTSGPLTDVEYRGALPYSFRFTLEITRFEPPRLMAFRSTGDLIGEGRWELAPRGSGTAVTHYWQVGTANPLFNLIVKLPFVRPLTEKNHAITMGRAYSALKQRLQA